MGFIPRMNDGVSLNTIFFNNVESDYFGIRHSPKSTARGVAQIPGLGVSIAMSRPCAGGPLSMRSACGIPCPVLCPFSKKQGNASDSNPGIPLSSNRDQTDPNPGPKNPNPNTTNLATTNLATMNPNPNTMNLRLATTNPATMNPNPDTTNPDMMNPDSDSMTAPIRPALRSPGPRDVPKGIRGLAAEGPGGTDPPTNLETDLAPKIQNLRKKTKPKNTKRTIPKIPEGNPNHAWSDSDA